MVELSKHARLFKNIRDVYEMYMYLCTCCRMCSHQKYGDY